jgi:hypothetical protein
LGLIEPRLADDDEEVNRYSNVSIWKVGSNESYSRNCH